MFDKKTKQLQAELESAKALVLEQESRLNELEIRVKELESPEYYEWKSMAIANKEKAGKVGHFYLNSKTDTLLLEQIISEINKDPDLCALLTTSDGTTLSLRVHPQPIKSTIKQFDGIGD